LLRLKHFFGFGMLFLPLRGLEILFWISFFHAVVSSFCSWHGLEDFFKLIAAEFFRFVQFTLKHIICLYIFVVTRIVIVP